MLLTNERDPRPTAERSPDVPPPPLREGQSQQHLLRLARLSEYEADGLALANAGDACFAAANAKLLAFSYRVEQDLEKALDQEPSQSELVELQKVYLTMMRQAGRYRQLELQANNLRDRTSGVALCKWLGFEDVTVDNHRVDGAGIGPRIAVIVTQNDLGPRSLVKRGIIVGWRARMWRSPNLLHLIVTIRTQQSVPGPANPTKAEFHECPACRVALTSEAKKTMFDTHASRRPASIASPTTTI